MKRNRELGPGCPACGSGAWRFRDARDAFHRAGEIPRAEVTATAVCADCDATFTLELAASDDSIWRSEVVPQTMGPLVGFGWLDRTLYARGRTLSGRGTHYHVEYRLASLER